MIKYLILIFLFSLNSMSDNGGEKQYKRPKRKHTRRKSNDEKFREITDKEMMTSSDELRDIVRIDPEIDKVRVPSDDLELLSTMDPNKIVKKLEFVRKCISNRKTGGPLFNSEAHMLTVIGNPNIIEENNIQKILNTCDPRAAELLLNYINPHKHKLSAQQLQVKSDLPEDILVRNPGARGKKFTYDPSVDFNCLTKQLDDKILYDVVVYLACQTIPGIDCTNEAYYDEELKRFVFSPRLQLIIEAMFSAESVWAGVFINLALSGGSFNLDDDTMKWEFLVDDKGNTHILFGELGEAGYTFLGRAEIGYRMYHCPYDKSADKDEVLKTCLAYSMALGYAGANPKADLPNEPRIVQGHRPQIVSEVKVNHKSDDLNFDIQSKLIANVYDHLRLPGGGFQVDQVSVGGNIALKEQTIPLLNTKEINEVHQTYAEELKKFEFKSKGVPPTKEEKEKILNDIIEKKRNSRPKTFKQEGNVFVQFDVLPATEEYRGTVGYGTEEVDVSLSLSRRNLPKNYDRGQGQDDRAMVQVNLKFDPIVGRVSAEEKKYARVNYEVLRVREFIHSFFTVDEQNKEILIIEENLAKSLDLASNLRNGEVETYEGIYNEFKKLRKEKRLIEAKNEALSDEFIIKYAQTKNRFIRARNSIISSTEGQNLWGIKEVNEKIERLNYRGSNYARIQRAIDDYKSLGGERFYPETTAKVQELEDFLLVLEIGNTP